MSLLRAGKVAQWLRAFAVLEEGPSTNIVAHIYP